MSGALLPSELHRIVTDARRHCVSSPNSHLAGVPGFEPRITESESVVLPVTPYPKDTAVQRLTCPRRESNPLSSPYKSAALTIWLRGRWSRGHAVVSDFPGACLSNSRYSRFVAPPGFEPRQRRPKLLVLPSYTTGHCLHLQALVHRLADRI